jgi:hypothetical protein
MWNMVLNGRIGETMLYHVTLRVTFTVTKFMTQCVMKTRGIYHSRSTSQRTKDFLVKVTSRIKKTIFWISGRQFQTGMGMMTSVQASGLISSRNWWVFINLRRCLRRVPMSKTKSDANRTNAGRLKQALYCWCAVNVWTVFMFVLVISRTRRAFDIPPVHCPLAGILDFG